MPKTLAERVESLEKTRAVLRELPARMSRVELRVTAVEEQVLQLRGEMRDGFSAVLDVIDASSAATQRMFDETRALVDATRAEAKDGVVGLREEMRMEFGAVHAEFANVRAGMSQEFASVRAEMSQEFANVRAEMSREFANVRAEMSQEFTNIRAEMGEEVANVRAEMGQEFTNVRAEMGQEFANVRAEVGHEFTNVRADMGAEFAHTRTEMRVLHEDLVERIARIGEGKTQKGRSKKRNRQG